VPRPRAARFRALAASNPQRCLFPEQLGVECACRQTLSIWPALDCPALSGTLDPGDVPAMIEREEPWTQLATRIPKDLHRRLKLYCVTNDTSVMEFVVEALKEKLARQGRGKRRTRPEGTS
jgi:hypothetical protein